ncbi:MAG TPA: D-alanine--D-alanine ligase [Anaerolineae bacterium]|nr:D-alanine--D-alanine ligase [Anaerolineae bacterium]HQI84071.1 D-alanine--D-alanine ligase [Anaerolineae bacterium]
MAKVALVYNLIHPELLDGQPPDTLAEFDSEETVAGLQTALEGAGHSVTLLEADESVAPQLKAVAPDIVFNIAEGRRGESRESYVPTICEMLGLPYTGSGPLTLALCLNKARAKEILLHYRIPTPRFEVMNSPDVPLNPALRFPMIVKLLQEGSSIGLSENSVVDDEAALRRQVAYLIRTYHEPVIVEEFIEGREFTIGVLGNNPPRPLPITEVVFSQPRGIVLFEPDPAVIARYPELWGNFTPKVHHQSICPANVGPELQAAIEATALRAYRALGCRDWCRMEMRLDAEGTLHVIELNPIAGIDASYWFARSAAVAGESYQEFVNEILNHALARHNNHRPHD